MNVYTAKILLFIALILGIAAFFGILLFMLSKKQGPKKKKIKKRRNEDDDYQPTDNPEAFSEVEKKTKLQRLSLKGKYPSTQTLTNLLDISDEEASEDFTTSLLSERELNNNPHYSEIVFESSSLSETGEVFEQNKSEENASSIDSLEERTQLLEELSISESEEDGGTALLFDEEEGTALLNDELELETEEDNDKTALLKNTDDEGDFTPVVSSNGSCEGDSIVKNEEEAPPGIEDKTDSTIETNPDHITADAAENNLSESEDSISSSDSRIPPFNDNIFSDQTLDGIEFGDADNLVFVECKLHNCSFDEVNLKNCMFINSELVNCSFKGCEMQGTLFKVAAVIDCNFKFSSLNGANMLSTIIKECAFEKADLDDAVLDKVQFLHCTFDKKTSFTDALLKEADFTSEEGQAGPDLSKVAYII